MAFCTKRSNAPSAALEFTEAVRPVRPDSELRTGYRAEVFHGSNGLDYPSLAAAASRDILFELFLDLLKPLGRVVDLVLETSHETGEIQERRRCGVDRPVLESYFYEYDDLLLNDGCTGVAVMATNSPREVQFDEHKQLIIYARNRRPFRRVLEESGLQRFDRLNLVCEAPHFHFTTADSFDRFEELARRLGAD